MKLIYFTSIAASAGAVDGTLMTVAITASVVGTTIARRFLEAMSDAQYRNWSARIIVTISSFYVLDGLYLLAIPVLWAA